MTKQIRVLIGDVGSGFAQTYADSLKKAGCWVVTVPQRASEILYAVTTEHPDEVVLDLSDKTFDVITLTEHLHAITVCKITAFFTEWNAYLIDRLRAGNVVCSMMPSLAELPRLAAVSNNSSRFEGLWRDVTELLECFCLNSGTNGFGFLRTAIILRYRKPLHERCPIMSLYALVGKTEGVPPANIERQIRVLISQGYNLRSQTKQTYYYHSHRIPDYEITAGAFISLAVEWLRIERNEAEPYLAELLAVGT